MKKQEQIDDPFLGALLKKVTIEEPAGDFTVLVMKRIEVLPEIQPHRLSLVHFFKKFIPWLILLVVSAGLLMVYQVSFFDAAPTGSYYKEEMFPLISRSFRSFFQLFSSKFILIALAVIFSGLMYCFIERWYARRQTHQNIPLF